MTLYVKHLASPSLSPPPLRQSSFFCVDFLKLAWNFARLQFRYLLAVTAPDGRPGWRFGRKKWAFGVTPPAHLAERVAIGQLLAEVHFTLLAAFGQAGVFGIGELA